MIQNLDIANVYIPFVHINNYFFDKFGSFEYKHTSTVLIESLLKSVSNNKESNFYVYVEEDIFEIVILKGKKLVFFNTFNYNTKEDFIYYILFTAEQLQLNPETFQLTFLNDIEKESELYKIAFKYIKNIDFYKPKYSLSKNLKISNHSYFTLINQYQ